MACYKIRSCLRTFYGSCRSILKLLPEVSGNLPDAKLSMAASLIGMGRVGVGSACIRLKYWLY